MLFVFGNERTGLQMLLRESTFFLLILQFKSIFIAILLAILFIIDLEHKSV